MISVIGRRVRKLAEVENRPDPDHVPTQHLPMEENSVQGIALRNKNVTYTLVRVRINFLILLTLQSLHFHIKIYLPCLSQFLLYCTHSCPSSHNPRQ